MNMNMNQNDSYHIRYSYSTSAYHIDSNNCIRNTNSKKVMNFSNVAQVENKNEVNEDPEENTVEIK